MDRLVLHMRKWQMGAVKIKDPQSPAVSCFCKYKVKAPQITWVILGIQALQKEAILLHT